MRNIRLLIVLFFIIPDPGFGQNYNVGEITLNFIDSVRNRPIKTELWFPTTDIDTGNKRKTELPFILEPTIRDAKIINQRFPIIIISHGTGGNRFGLAWLAIALAKQGYIVASPDHWGNTFDNKIPEYFVRYWERPIDMSFVLTQLISDKTLSNHIDTSRIGAVGFSFGGYTSLALAGVEINCNLLKTNAKTNQGKKEFTIPEMGDLRKLIEKLPCDNYRLKDNRIKAFVALAPALGLGINSKVQTKDVISPILIIGAENDQIAPVLTNAKVYKSQIPSSEYIELTGKIGHYVFLNVGDEMLIKEAKKYYKDDESVNRKLIHTNVEKLVINFFDINIKK